MAQGSLPNLFRGFYFMPVIVADENSITDGSAFELLCQVRSDVPIVLVAWAENFKFNKALLAIENYVLVCFCEYGWDHNLTDTHIWGKNTEHFPRYCSEGYRELDEWVKSNPPKLMLKRELLKKDTSDTIKPIEYPCRHKTFQQTKEEFDARVFSVFNYWGRSHEKRLTLHGNIWVEAGRHGYSVCDNLYQLQHFVHEHGDKWVTLHIPHYSRIPMEELLQVNGNSKISISFPGAGKKCFRHGESSLNSVMALEKSDLAWSYDWNETNSIQFEIGNEIPTIIEALKRDDLYDIYLAGTSNCENYQIGNYVSKYLEPLINQ